jgi:hypothetical protein
MDFQRGKDKGNVGSKAHYSCFSYSHKLSKAIINKFFLNQRPIHLYKIVNVTRERGVIILGRFSAKYNPNEKGE